MSKRLSAYTVSLNGRVVYVGITKSSVERRWRQHQRPSSRCVALARAIKKYGATSFTIEHVASSWDVEGINAIERLLIEQYQTFGLGGYNLSTGGGQGRIFSDEVRDRIRVGAKASHSSPQVRAKMSASATKRYSTPEGRAAQSASQQRRWTPEARAAQAERARIQQSTADARAARSAIMKAYFASPEIRRAHGEKTRARLAAPEQRAAHSARIKAAYARRSARTV